MNRSESNKIRLGVMVPGLHGGVDEAAKYIYESGAFERTQLKMYRTKGLGSKRAPFRFALTLSQVVIDRIRGNLDVVHVNVSSRGSTLRKVLISVVLKALQIPYVVQLHSGGYQRFWDSLPSVAKVMVRPLFHRASRTLILGNAFRDFVTDEIGVPPERVLVIPNGVPVPTRRHQHHFSKPTVLFVGRLNQNKGYLDLLAALDQCSDLDWSAVLMGDGETEQARNLVQRYDLTDRIMVEGWTDRVLVNKTLDSSSILVSPSYSEALSLTLLEAMAHGLACIATPVGAHLDVLANELNSLTVQPGEVDQLSKALRRLISSPDLQRELGEAARDDINRWFSIDTVCSRLEETYHQVLSESM